MKKCRIFVSYTMRENGISLELLQGLKQCLNKHGLIETYIDILDNCGKDHQLFVEDQLQKSDAVLLIQSDGIDSSEWVKREIHIAKERGIPICTLSLDQIKDITKEERDLASVEKELLRLAQTRAL